MKKQIISWGMMLAAAFTLTNCAQEIANPNEQPETAGYPFEIVASTVDTKTVNDGMATKWAEGDQINLFHAMGETTEYVNDNAFSLKDLEEGKFEGKLGAELDSQEEYDWFAFYPYSSYITTPALQTKGYTYIGGRSDTPQTQNGANNMTHIAGKNYPLYGKVVAVPAATQPELTMSHASTLLEVKVTNTLETELAVENVKFTAPAGTSLVGTFYLNITGDEVVYTDGQFVSNVAELSVSNATLAADASASFYLAVKPFTAAKNSKLCLSVNGYERELTMPNDVTFSAGKIKTLNFSYDKEEAPAPEGTSVVTIDLSAQGYENSQAVSTVSNLPVSIEFNKGSSSNAPAYYTSGTAVRVYGGGSFKVSTIAGKITNIKLTYGSSDGSNDITVDSGTFNTDTWSGEANSVKFTIGGTSGNRRIKAIEVTVVGGVAAEPTKLDAPIVECSGQASNSLTFEWNAVTNAVGYEVSFNGGEAKTITETTYVAEGLEAETLYEISVKAIGDGTYYLTSDANTCSESTTPKSEQPSGPITVSKSIKDISGTPPDGTKVSTMKLDDVISASASTSGNNGKVYSSGAQWRLYQANSGTVTISAKDGYLINTVKFTFTVSNNGVLKKGNSTVNSGIADTVNASSVTYSVGSTSGTSGQVRVTNIEVVYQAE